MSALFSDIAPAVESVVIDEADLVNGHSAEDVFISNAKRTPEGSCAYNL
jgi:hypothetical protein